MQLGAERGLLVSGAWLRRDREDVFHPPTNATEDEIREEQELIQKYYQLGGVNADCTPVASGSSNNQPSDQ